MDQSSGTCANINAGTDKMSSLPQMGSCSVGQVDGVKIRSYKKDDCTDDPNGYVVGSNSCSGHLKYECNGEDITVNTYNSEGCIGNIVYSATCRMPASLHCRFVEVRDSPERDICFLHVMVPGVT